MRNASVVCVVMALAISIKSTNTDNATFFVVLICIFLFFIPVSMVAYY